MNKPQVIKVRSCLVDPRLPIGELLIEVYDDGEFHVAYRESANDSWPKGFWSLDWERKQRQLATEGILITGMERTALDSQ
jgi:hypothetical protein